MHKARFTEHQISTRSAPDQHQISTRSAPDQHQISTILKSVEVGHTVKDVCREAGIYEASY